MTGHAAAPGVVEASRRLRDREVSAVELLEACQRWIAERNGGPPTFDGAPDAINAWVRLYPEVATRQAREADARLAREGRDAPLLCGVPVGVKDLYAVAGLPVTASSRVLEGNVATRDAVAWARLRRDGAVLIGHTHTHEFAAGGTTDQVGNPWALDRTAGGSSGGSGAALAAGMVPAALGTDTAGSLRIPAALCGVSAIKPTHGRVPMGGIVPLAPSLDHAGPMARTVADCAVLLQALCAGGAEATPLMPPPAAIGRLPLSARPGDRPLAGTRVATTDRTDGLRLHPDVADGLAAVRDLCERLGAEIVQRPAPATFDGRDFNAILVPELVAGHAGYADRRSDYRPSVGELLDQAPRFAAAQSYLGAQARRAGVAAAWARWFAEERIDVVLEPTAPTPATPRGTGYDLGNAGGDGDPLIVLTAMWNVTGAPVVALPAGVGRRTGLPVGVSLVGRHGDEAGVIQTAIDLQERRAPPGPPAP